MKKCFLLICFFLLFFVSAYAQNNSPLFISMEDLRLEQEGEPGFENGGGFHLYIRKKPGINSVLLTETTKDPLGREDNYAYRALEWNAINGNERRMLDGQVLNSLYSRYSLIDSTPEPDAQFGEAFHIYIPRTITYGYEWSRHGTLQIDRWTFINIRAFALPFGDYSAEFLDNPFMFDLGAPVKIANVESKAEPAPVPRQQPVAEEPKPAPVVQYIPPSPIVEEQKPDIVVQDITPLQPVAEESKQEIPVLTDDYNPNAAREFEEISDFMTYSKGPETIVEDITNALEKINPKDKVDVVFVIDTTGSMKDDIEKLRKEWVPVLMDSVKHFSDIRLGLTLYRDYGSSGYNYKMLPVKFYDFTRSVESFFTNLNNFSIYGTEGGDIPEAVYEALYAALDFYEWRGDAQRKIILIGDAEPHPTPRGTRKYTKQYIKTLSNFKRVDIEAIIVPDNKTDRGR